MSLVPGKIRQTMFNTLMEVVKQRDSLAIRVEHLEQEMEYLLQACDDSDDAQYSTLGTKFVRNILNNALKKD